MRRLFLRFALWRLKRAQRARDYWIARVDYWSDTATRLNE
jgi:hypothetical protein